MLNEQKRKAQFWKKKSPEQANREWLKENILNSLYSDVEDMSYNEFYTNYFSTKEFTDWFYNFLLANNHFTGTINQFYELYCSDLDWYKKEVMAKISSPSPISKQGDNSLTKTDGTDNIPQFDPTKKKWSMQDTFPKVAPGIATPQKPTWKDTNVTGDQIKAGGLVRYGEKGDIVTQIQNLLIKHNFPNISRNNIPDGLFGSKTLASVKQFQTANGLKPDGIVGPLTWEKLNAEPNVDLSKLSTRPNEFNSSINPENQPIQEAKKLLKEIFEKYSH